MMQIKGKLSFYSVYKGLSEAQRSRTCVVVEDKRVTWRDIHLSLRALHKMRRTRRI